MKSENIIEYKVKNIVDAFLNKEFNVFVQGCNCFCGFGRGLADEVLQKIPDAYHKADALTKKGDLKKLGTYSQYVLEPNYIIVNAYTQFHWIKRKNNEPKAKKGRGYVLANYDAIRESLKSIAVEFQGLHIGLPLIGAGWANGDWDIISNIIKEELIDNGIKVTVYVLKIDDLPNTKAL